MLEMFEQRSLAEHMLFFFSEILEIFAYNRKDKYFISCQMRMNINYSGISLLPKFSLTSIEYSG